ncbi:hypothetical protein BDZ91DRAFT_793053 [Kalaharituber pfeilii]|nr:hypothetical protein BDZ91DRAFT_793053 [Kalaharituber pfeilii]
MSSSASSKISMTPGKSDFLPAPTPGQSPSFFSTAAERLPGQPSTSNPASTPSKMADINIDPEGDITLAVPHSLEGSTVKAIAYFRVNSQILCIASPVFRAMLSKTSSFKEATSLAKRDPSSEPTEVQLLDDNPKALAIILRAIHLQSDWVPDSPTTEQLYEIAILCDKYDMRQSLEQWLRNWIPQRESEASTNPHKWLFISIAFGRKRILSDVSRSIILNYTPGTSGLFGGLFGGTVFDPHVPQFYVDEIRKRWETAIQSILTHIEKLLCEYGAPITPTPFVFGANDQLKCQLTSHKPELCDTFMLGQLIKEFKQIGAYPASATFRERSVKAITTLLSSLKFPDEIIFQKPIECCKTPHFQQIGSSSLWGAPPQQSTIKCVNCNKIKQEPPNHAKCSPKKRLITGVNHIIAKIQGLEYREGAGKRAVTELRPPATGTDLWDCITYKDKVESKEER